MRLYLAGPDIFQPEARAIAARKRALCLEHGFTPLHPLDGALPAGATPGATAMAIYEGNRGRMWDADAIIADLTPFRGPSADPGTVFELGFMMARGRPAFAYSREPSLFRQRTVAALPGAVRHPDGRWLDAEGLEIEDFGLHDNLMLDCALALGGHSLMVPAAPEPPACLDGFERCLVAARAHLGPSFIGR